MSDQKREFFRIIYPLGKPAKLETKFGPYPVVDVSQRGVKFLASSLDLTDRWKSGMTTQVKICFLSGAVHDVSATVVRIGADHIALKLVEPIPLKTMYDEHRFIIQNFDQK